MGSFETTRKQIREEIKNEDLRSSALFLADSIERMSNIYSNSLKHGVKEFDVPELYQLIETAKSVLLKEVL